MNRRQIRATVDNERWAALRASSTFRSDAELLTELMRVYEGAQVLKSFHPDLCLAIGVAAGALGQITVVRATNTTHEREQTNDIEKDEDPVSTPQTETKSEPTTKPDTETDDYDEAQNF